MESTDHLFQLIKSLTQAEKRYFKLEASKYSGNVSDNDYIQLYDIIEQSEVYDEKAIKEKLKGNKLLKRFAAIKNYLYNTILKCLTQLHSDNDTYSKIHNLLQQITVLYNRGFYKQVRKKLNQAKKLTEDFQKFDYALVINRWELRLAEFESTHEKCKEKMTELLAEKEAGIERLKLEFDMEWLYEEGTNEVYEKGMAREEDEKLFFQKFLSHETLLKAQKSNSPYIQSLAYAFEDVVSFMSGVPHEEILEIANKRMSVFEGLSEDLMKEYGYYYAAAVFDYVQVLLARKDFETAYRVIKEIEVFWKEHQDYWDGFTDNMFFMTVYYHSTKIPRLNGDFESIASLGKSLKKEFEKRIGREDQDRAFYIVLLNMSYGYFALGDYDNALFWLREILNDQTNTIRPDVLGFIHIFHLMLQFEMGNRSILLYQVDRTQRFLSKNNHLRDFERYFLSFFRKVSNLPIKDPGIEDLFLKLKKYLVKLADADSFEKRYINEFYLIEWIDSRLNKQPYANLVRQKMATIL